MGHNPKGGPLTTLETAIGYTFANPQLLLSSLTHKSYFNENRDLTTPHNERLEFLGDAVLDLAVSDILMKTFPEDQEGQLSRKRASLVNEKALAEIALQLKLDQAVYLGKGEMQNGGANNSRILACTLEAVIGALYLEAGYERSKLWIEQLIQPGLSVLAQGPELTFDYKTRLQESLQKTHQVTPTYRLVNEEGPSHERIYTVEVLKQNEVLAVAQGRSKKQAEQAAAQIALQNALAKEELSSMPTSTAQVDSAGIDLMVEKGSEV